MKQLNISKRTKDLIITYGIVIVPFIIISILKAGGNISTSLSGQLVPICAYIVMAVSLNLTVGILGELSLGHAGFMSVGAFSGIIAANCLSGGLSDPIRLVIAVIIGGIMAGIMGVIVGVPVLRLRGDYLAIVTLAFGEIIKNIINCLYVGVDSAGLHISMTDVNALHLEETGTVVINGPQGATTIPQLSTFFAGFVVVIITLIVVLNLTNSRSGRAIMALRDNRIAAESVGIGVTKYKLMAFVTSAVLAGMAGVIYAMNYSTVVAKKFDFNTSILVLVFVVLGGMGNIRGSIIAAALLTVLPEVLRAFSDYRMLVYAVVLILVMIVGNNPTMNRLLRNVTEPVKAFFNSKKKQKTGGGDLDD